MHILVLQLLIWFDLMVWCDDTKPCVTAEHAGVRVQNKNLPEIIYSPIILHSYANFVLLLHFFVISYLCFCFYLFCNSSLKLLWICFFLASSSLWIHPDQHQDPWLFFVDLPVNERSAKNEMKSFWNAFLV